MSRFFNLKKQAIKIFMPIDLTGMIKRKAFFADFPNMIGAAHGLEIAFLTTEYKFGPVSNYVYPKTDERDQMEETFLSAWSNFAKKENLLLKMLKFSGKNIHLLNKLLWSLII